MISRLDIERMKYIINEIEKKQQDKLDTRQQLSLVKILENECKKIMLDEVVRTNRNILDNGFEE